MAGASGREQRLSEGAAVGKGASSLGSYSLVVSHEVFAFLETSQLLTQSLADSRGAHEMFEGLREEERDG